MNDRQLVYLLIAVVLLIFGMTILTFSVIDIANNQEEVNLATLKKPKIRTSQWIFLGIAIFTLLISLAFFIIFAVSWYRLVEKTKSKIQTGVSQIKSKMNTTGRSSLSSDSSYQQLFTLDDLSSE